MRSPTLLILVVTLFFGGCQKKATENKAVPAKEAPKPDSKSKDKTPEPGTKLGDKKDGEQTQPNTDDKTGAKPKVDPNLRLIADVKKKLDAAISDYDKYERAEQAGNEEQRKKYIRLASKKLDEVQAQIEKMRVPPLIDEDEYWKEEYKIMETYEREIGNRLHDIAKRSMPSDFK